MKVSYEWLKEYVDLEVTPEELADLLWMSGTEVEKVDRPGAGVKGVVVASVVEVSPHPNADKLRLAVVDDGSVRRTVVCGAPNLAAGMKSALALPGARLPRVSSSELRKAKIRGVESDGMLVSAAELGISEDHSGIIELEQEAQVGLDVSEVLPVDDAILDLEITPNRPDCMCMVGIAREVAAVSGARLRMPGVVTGAAGRPVEELVTIKIEDPEGCPRYSARAVTGVRIGASPPWMQRRLVAAGLRPISNVVDVTNYVLLELGQPLHAFDLDLLGDRTIIVRRARRGEAITTLDDVERELDEQSLVIADAERPVAVAGIIGGEDSEVTVGTANVLIESAYFDPTSILLTSRRLGVRTEASARFERGCDPLGTVRAADRAALLIGSLAGGEIATGAMDVFPRGIHPVTVELRPARVNRVLGTEISRRRMAEILRALGAEVSESEPLVVTVPAFRPDLTREIDLVEEVGRVNGYDRIEESLPEGGGFDAGLTREQEVEARLQGCLVSLGLSQVVTYSFMRTGDLRLLGLEAEDPRSAPLRLLNPLAETGEAMRTTLLPGLLRCAVSNVNRGNGDLAIFERGRVFIPRGGGELPAEQEKTGVLICGRAAPSNWSGPPREVDFFDLKGTIEDLFSLLGAPGPVFKPSREPFLAPGRSASISIGGECVGYAGQVRQDVAEGFGLEPESYVCEINAAALVESVPPISPYAPFGRFPNVKVDIAAVVDEGVEAMAVEGIIRKIGGEMLRAIRLFDVYRGPQVPEGKKSLAYALEFGSAEETLTDERAHARMDGIIGALEKELGASIRGREEGRG